MRPTLSTIEGYQLWAIENLSHLTHEFCQTCIDRLEDDEL